ncbi:hypothetical protein IQ255_18595 [Pleurocapsales cyanobacterium LEGE 10410]|nr:hypothetical protein [Pleurocapsales cyanobacterium LEGE 10410]
MNLSQKFEDVVRYFKINTDYFCQLQAIALILILTAFRVQRRGGEWGRW